MFDNLQHAMSAAGLDSYWIREGDTIPVTGGSYIIVLELEEPVEITLQKSGTHHLPPGTYCYAGSAFGPGGLKARVGRHLKREKKVHWHVDRLTTKAATRTAQIFPDVKECDLITALLATGSFEIPASGFGSTDCSRCESHLLMLKSKKV